MKNNATMCRNNLPFGVTGLVVGGRQGLNRPTITSALLLNLLNAEEDCGVEGKQYPLHRRTFIKNIGSQLNMFFAGGSIDLVGLPSLQLGVNALVDVPNFFKK